jgi:flavin reductase (DIM6/NTAB) family NADH-FMN oxidoreductase RutF
LFFDDKSNKRNYRSSGEKQNSLPFTERRYLMIIKPFLREAFIPLPVTFISTISKKGVRNIAPWSCVMPVLRPLDLICAASAKKRDTLDNIREMGQFVLNLPGTDLADKVIPTARKNSPEVDEFEVAGLDEKPSTTIQAPGIAGCYAWMECELYREYEEEKYVLIVGEKAKPLMMTGSKKGMNFCTVTDLGKYEPFSAMFPGDKDPFATRYDS